MSDTAIPPQASATPPARKLGKNAFLFVIVTVLIDMIGFGMIIPVIPFLLSDITGLPVEQVTPYGGLLTAIYGVMNFLAGPTLGSLSDRFGRRRVLLISMATLAVDFIIMGLAHSLWLLIIGRVLSGISAATISTANAYIADVTEPAERGRAFGMMGAAFGVGFIIGPVLGGLLGEIDPRAPFFAAAGLAGLNVLYGLFVLPESLPKEERRAFDWKRANPFGAAKHFSKLPRIVWLLIAFSMLIFAQWVYPSTWSYHAGVRYGWDSGQIGFSLGLVGLGAAIVQGGLVGPLIKRIGAPKAALVGIGFGLAAFLAYSFAALPWMVYMIIPLGSLAGFTNPSLQSIMSAEVTRDAQGELQGAIASLNSLTQILSVVVMTQVFYFFTGGASPVYLPGAAFILSFIVGLLALIPLSIGFRRLGVFDKPVAEQKTPAA
jgi:MFS transporter, DHA1 family, tetracycline resistance protein